MLFPTVTIDEDPALLIFSGHLSWLPDPAGQPYGDGCATGKAYLKPGYLSQQQRSPAFTLGGKNRRSLQDAVTPGPASYDRIAAERHTLRATHTSSWGPPPR